MLLVDDDDTTNFPNERLLDKLGVAETVLVARNGQEDPARARRNLRKPRHLPRVGTARPQHARDVGHCLSGSISAAAARPADLRGRAHYHLRTPTTWPASPACPTLACCTSPDPREGGCPAAGAFSAAS
ncbi:MAG: hypothetical protein WKG07_39675 [Hymenobacter sp.]